MLKKIRPYVGMMQLTHQSPILVAFFFGLLDAKYLVVGNILLIALGLLLLSINSFVINEYVDAQDTDKYSQRKRTLTIYRVSGRVVGLICAGLVIAGGILFYYHLCWQALIIVVAGTIYSLPPLRFKARFPHDIITLAIYFVAIPYSIGFTLNGLDASKMLAIPFWALGFFFFCTEGFHFLADLDADRKAGLRNTPVSLGYNNLIKVLITSSFVASLGFIFLAYQHSHWWYYPLIIFSLLSILAFGYARGVMYDQERLTRRFNLATKVGISIGNYLFICQFALIVFLSAL